MVAQILTLDAGFFGHAQQLCLQRRQIAVKDVKLLNQSLNARIVQADALQQGDQFGLEPFVLRSVVRANSSPRCSLATRRSCILASLP